MAGTSSYRVLNVVDAASPAASPARSGRKGSKKVRTGCITCKIRKVKCDEVRPYCLRCTKTGRTCDGYLEPSAASTRRHARNAVPLSVLLETATADEKRSFHFFQYVTAPSLSGDLDGVFWRVIVLQVCHREPAVRHAVLAVSSLHEGLMQGTVTPFADDPGPKQSFALQQYNKAIACLLDQIKDPSSKPMVPLLTCVLFVCIEFMQSKEKESLLHLEQGRQILGRLGRKADSADPEIEVIKQHLVAMYTRLGLACFLFGGTLAPIPDTLKVFGNIPDAFDSLQEIRFSLHETLEQVLRFTQRSRSIKYDETTAKVMVSLGAEQGRLMKHLERLHVAFSLYKAAKPKEGGQSAAMIIEIYANLAKIWLTTALSKLQTTYDDCITEFSAIVPLAAAVISSEAAMVLTHYPSLAASPRSSESPGRGGPRSTVSFSFETHLIPALYFVATKCRHPLVRHAALDLLQQNPAKRENLWRADIFGAIAAYIIDVEERGMKLYSIVADARPAQHVASRLYDVNDGQLFPSGQSTPTRGRKELDPRFLGTSRSRRPASSAPPESLNPLLLASTHTSIFDPDSPAAPVGQLGMEASSSPAPSVSGSLDSLFGADPTTPAPGPDWIQGLAPSSPSDAPRPASPAAHRQSIEAPFDLPEHLRVHDAIIRAEKRDGCRVMVFRKLNGADAGWDVQSEYVRVGESGGVAAGQRN